MQKKTIGKEALCPEASLPSVKSTWQRAFSRVFFFAECFLFGTWQRASLPSVQNKKLSKLKGTRKVLSSGHGREGHAMRRFSIWVLLLCQRHHFKTLHLRVCRSPSSHGGSYCCLPWPRLDWLRNRKYGGLIWP